MKRKYLWLPVAALLLSVLFLVPQPSFAAPEEASPQAETRAKGDGLQWDGDELIYVVNGERVRNKWVTLNGKTYYFDSNGWAARGVYPFGDVVYYFDKKTGAQVKGRWVTDGQWTFYFNKYGPAYKGFKTIDGVEYYFDTENGVQYKGRWFYATRPGVNWGMFHTNKYGVVSRGYRWIDGLLYHFDEGNGMCHIGTWGSQNGKTYFFEEYYCAAYGLRTLYGNTYFFDLTTFAMYRNRWKSVGPDTYYFLANGHAAKGLLHLNGVLYIFDENGVQYKNKQVKIGEYYYWVNPYGVATLIGTHPAG